MAATRLVDGSADVALQQISELLAAKGVTVVGPLPAAFELATVYSVAVHARARQPELARRLVDLLAGPGAREVRERGGFAATAGD